MQQTNDSEENETVLALQQVSITNVRWMTPVILGSSCLVATYDTDPFYVLVKENQISFLHCGHIHRSSESNRLLPADSLLRYSFSSNFAWKKEVLTLL